MDAQIATVASSNGSLASLASSLVNVGTTTKAFVVAHPLSMAATGGALVGIMLYRSLSKRRDRKKKPVEQEATPVMP
jgi:hypothetical protein